MTTHIESIVAGEAHALVWSESGEIGCTRKGHAPYPGSDTWRSAGWRVMRFDDRVELAAELGAQPQCESCAADARAAKAVPQ